MTVEILTTREAAGKLRLSARYLEALGANGGGPRFLSFGKAIRSRATDLEAWAASCSRLSTSDSGGNAA